MKSIRLNSKFHNIKKKLNLSKESKLIFAKVNTIFRIQITPSSIQNCTKVKFRLIIEKKKLKINAELFFSYLAK